MRIKQPELGGKLYSLFLVRDSEKGFFPIILIIVLGVGILIFSGIIFSRVYYSKNPGTTPKPSSQLALISPSPSSLQDQNNADEEDLGGDEGDNVNPADLEGPD